MASETPPPVAPSSTVPIVAPSDWSFTHLTLAETRWGPHGYHRYPAKFIPQLVARLIGDYSAPGSLVADPFLGSGTSGVEAIRMGRRFWARTSTRSPSSSARQNRRPYCQTRLTMPGRACKRGLSLFQ